ncbi:MAG: S9 family peptidase [Betaproteobacteria bacterium]|nr:S9 family peptidase [Betaproteobacteria bacterium]
MKFAWATGAVWAGFWLSTACAQDALPAKGATAAAAAYTRARDIPVEVFFRRPQNARVVLSPDGSRVAATIPLRGRENLVVIDLAAGKRLGSTGFSDADVSHFEWVTNDRLYLTTADLADASGEIRFRSAYAIDVDGSNLRDLRFPLDRASARQSRASSVQTSSHVPGLNILSRTFDGSGDVITQLYGRSQSYTDVYRYNTLTGEYKLLTFDTPGNVMSWVIDRDLVPRVAVRAEERTDPAKPREITIWHREREGAPWEKIGSNAGEGESRISPIAFDYDNKTLYVASNAGRDRTAIYKYDIAQKKLGELVVEHPLIDLSGGLVFSRERRKLTGIRFNADVPATAWFDEDMARMQDAIDKAFPGRHNRLFVADEGIRWALVESHSATQTPIFYLYDREKKHVQVVARTRPWLEPHLMPERTFLRYTARDGTVIPAWLTLPRGAEAKNLPLVVHVHGGPWVRGFSGNPWGRQPIAPFLASRGYAVLEPEPRGSTGFGRKHYLSSFRQWGLAMQDDITDGALHLVKEGIADKARMCLFGASYGGYATLQGLVKDPDLWRCGSAYVAVTDLELMQTIQYSDTARLSDFYETDFKRRVGDKDRDRAQFEATSPARNVARIKAAVQLTMGSDDQRVPLKHGEAFRDAMDRAGKAIDYVVYTGEAHGFNKDENVFDFYTRVERFLAQHLKP